MSDDRGGQNRSAAVMAQRTTAARGALDYFPTPPWATRALCEYLTATWPAAMRRSVWEPAAGGGAMVRALAETFARVVASDIHDYGAGYTVRDYLARGGLFEADDVARVDWVITNPPFAAAFADCALADAERGVALLVRLGFLEGIGRHKRLFAPAPPHSVLIFTERVAMVEGRLDPAASTATAYAWVIWDVAPDPLAASATRLGWIAPCRRRLERPGDYAEAMP